MSVIEDDGLLEKPQAENQAEISLEFDEEPITDDVSVFDAAQTQAEETASPAKDDWVADAGVDTDGDRLSEDAAAAPGTIEEAAADETAPGSEPPPGGHDTGITDPAGDDLPPGQPAESEINDFAALDDDETAAIPLEQQAQSKQIQPDNHIIEGEIGEAAVEKSEDRDLLDENSQLEDALETAADTQPAPQVTAGLSWVNKIISGALIMLIVGGIVLYYNPSLIGLTRAQAPAAPAPVKAGDTPAAAAPSPTPPATPGMDDQCRAKIKEAIRLRDVLLEKNEEIYNLNRHYRAGIAELVQETHRQIKQSGVTTYEAALKNKRIELNMRTVQRRQAYINGLIKPAFWLNSGSEELLYLVRKARLDLQLTDIAGGVDLKKHMRHIDAAIQKYRPSPEKLAVDPQQSNIPPLETIWEQVLKNEQPKGHENEPGQLALNPKDKRIINEICSGHFNRIAELTNISATAAKCLARMNGPDLFLNGLLTLSPDAAEHLFQWQGNWICLNGITHLSPAAAQYLFRWKGNWISLNSLSDFPPELAQQLLKWEGQQLELMGLDDKADEAFQKTLKYLALWETMGGKLFVTDTVRQKIKSLM